MRLLVVGSVVACLIAGGAQAIPAQPAPLGRTAMPVEPIRWTCNQYRCLDQWTGNETASFCDEDGCHPARAMARRAPVYGYEPAPPPRRYGYGYRYAPPPPPPEYGYEDE